METTKTAEAAESATGTEIDATAAEVETDKDLLVEGENDTADNEHEDSDADDEHYAHKDTAGAAPAAKAPVLAGAAAVIAAGLGLSSLTGTWIADLMAERQNIIAQAAGTATTTNQQIAMLYGTPWHTTALFNGLFAFAAILVGGIVLLTARTSAPWVRALAWGALALGVIGLFIAGVMWFDVFTDIPHVAETATTSSSTG